MNFKNIVASMISEILAKKGYQISAGFSGFTGSGSLIYSDLFSGILKVLILTKGLLVIFLTYQKMPTKN